MIKLYTIGFTGKSAEKIFTLLYQNNDKLLTDVKQLYLTLSLSVIWNDWYYKLVAAIIL